MGEESPSRGGGSEPLAAVAEPLDMTEVDGRRGTA